MVVHSCSNRLRLDPLRKRTEFLDTGIDLATSQEFDRGRFIRRRVSYSRSREKTRPRRRRRSCSADPRVITALLVLLHASHGSETRRENASLVQLPPACNGYGAPLAFSYIISFTDPSSLNLRNCNPFHIDKTARGFEY